MPEARRELFHADEPHWVIPHSCAVCVKCWFVVEGKGAGRCVHGGPYLGYQEVREPVAA